MKKAHSSLALCLFLCTTSAWATDVSVVGLFNGKAIITVNRGPQKLLREGESTPEGVKLISADSKEAVLEIDGKREALGLGQGTSTGGIQSGGKESVTIPANAQGHFLVQGSINGSATQFLVDTGATAVSMSSAEAKRLGISYLKGERGFSSTANGVTPVYRVTLNSVKVGDITLTNVEGIVHESSLPIVLLGMSFLKRVDMKREGNSMVLMKRF